MSEKDHKDLVDIFSAINRKFEIVGTTWDAEFKNFEAKIRTQIPTNNEDFSALCHEWVNLFSQVTETVWVKTFSNTGPQVRFRQRYQCWTQGGTVIKKELLFDLRRCKASLDIKVLTDNRPKIFQGTKKKFVKLGLNVLVRLYFQHLHPVDICRPYAFFVHKCEPQSEVPKPVIQENPKLPELVAAMVQNGPYVSRKAAERALAKMNNYKKDTENFQDDSLKDNKMLNNTKTGEDQESARVGGNQETSTFATLRNVEPIKFIGNESQVQQYSQFIMGSSQLDDQFIMYPLIFDTPQVIMIDNQTQPLLRLIPKDNIN